MSEDGDRNNSKCLYTALRRDEALRNADGEWELLEFAVWTKQHAVKMVNA
jgi:hypothetical protein